MLPFSDLLGTRGRADVESADVLLPGADDLLRLDAVHAASIARSIADALDAGPGASARATDAEWSSIAQDRHEGVLQDVEERGRAIAAELRYAASVLTGAALAQ